MSSGISGSSEGFDLYEAYMPFELAPGATLNRFDSPIELEREGFTLRLTQLLSSYALSAGPFESQSEATRYLDVLRMALLWFSLTKHVGLRCPQEGRGVTFFDGAIQVAPSSCFHSVVAARGWDTVEGLYYAADPVVIPKNRRILRSDFGKLSANVAMEGPFLLASIDEALSLGRLDDVASHQKLKLAIELHGLSRFESSETARFLNLVSVLECLLPDRKIGGSAMAALSLATKSAKECRDEYQWRSNEWNEIDALVDRIRQLKRISIGMNLREYIASLVSRYPELGDPVETQAEIKIAYSLRSNLLHRGEPGDHDIKRNLVFLQKLVPHILVLLFRDTAGTAGTPSESRID